MSSQHPSLQQEKDFQKIIDSYKENFFKKMPILHHEFIYACFHPTIEDCIIALEKNYYPVESEIYILKDQPVAFFDKVFKNLEAFQSPEKIKRFAEMIGLNKELEKVDEDDEFKTEQSYNIEEQSENQNLEEKVVDKCGSNDAGSMIKVNPNVDPEHLKELTNKLKSSVMDKIVRDKSLGELNNQKNKIWQDSKSSKAKGDQQKLVTKKTVHLNSNIGSVMSHEEVKTSARDIYHNNQSKEEFSFHEPRSMYEEKLHSAQKKKYGISLWKINRGTQAFQIKEHSFNHKLIGDKFYVSHNGKQIVLFVGTETAAKMDGASPGAQFHKIKIIHSESLTIIKQYKMNSQLLISNQHLYDSALIWDCSQIYLQFFDKAQFLNLKTNEIKDYSLLYDNVEKNSDKFKKIITNKKIQHMLFKESEPGIFYGVAETHKQKIMDSGKVDNDLTSFELLKININNNKIFLPQHKYLSISKYNLKYNGTIGYNKDLTEIIFPGEQVFYYFKINKIEVEGQLNNIQNVESTLQPIKSVQNCQVGKNSFINDHIWLQCNDENYLAFTTSTENLTKKYPLINFDLDNYALGDSCKEAHSDDQEQYVISIGRNNSKNASASSRFCMNASKAQEQSDEPEQINYINEMSQFICVYPFLIFCKGNAEMFMQSLHNPKKMIKLDLQDQFLCFVDINHDIAHKPDHIALGMPDGDASFKKFESIAFLSQKNNKIHINILEFKQPLGGSEVCSEAKGKNHKHHHKENDNYNPNDQFERLEMQVTAEESYVFYRSAISVERPQKIYKFPIIYLPSKKHTKPDLGFFVSKDGFSTKVERICFNVKDMKESPILPIHELKTQNVYIFNLHNGFFYIMDDSLSLKQFKYERRGQKLKLMRIFEFAYENRELFLNSQSEFNDIQITEKGAYKGDMFIPFYDSNMYNKNISMIKVEQVLNIRNQEDLFEGPKKIQGTEYVMYIARENKDIEDENDNDESDTNSIADIEIKIEKKDFGADIEKSVMQSIDKTSKFFKGAFHRNQTKSVTFLNKQQKDDDLFTHHDLEEIKLEGINSKSIPNKLKDTDNDKLALLSPESQPLKIASNQRNMESTGPVQYEDQRRISLFDKNLEYQSEKRTKQMMISKNKISSFSEAQDYVVSLVEEQNAALEEYNEQVYAWIVPFIDSNVIHLTHRRDDNSNPQYETTFSTFIGSDQILCQINSVFYIFSKNGSFLYEVKIQKQNYEDQFYFLKADLILQNVSSNLKYFLFYNETRRMFSVFKLISVQNASSTVNNSPIQVGEKSVRSSTHRNKNLFNKSTKIASNLKDEVQIYKFIFIKDIEERAKNYNLDDYFHQRHVSNQGLVFQMVQQLIEQMGQDEVEEYKTQKELLKRKADGKHRQSIKVPQQVVEPTNVYISQKQYLQHQNSQQFFEDLNPDNEKIVNSFQFFIDNEQITQFDNNFKLIKEHLESKSPVTQEFLSFGLKIISTHLFIRRGNQLEYLKIFKQIPPIQEEIESMDTWTKTHGTLKLIDIPKGTNKKNNAKMINLKFDKGVKVLRIMSTVREDLVQIIASDDRFMFVITWDIIKNIEYSMIQVENRFKYQVAHLVCKGISEKLNYIPIENGVYDLYYSLPFLFFQNLTVSTTQKPNMSLNEKKLSRFNSEFIDIFDNNKVYLSYSLLDLFYMKALKAIKSDMIDSSHILVNHLFFRANGLTIFHEFSLNQNLLKHILEEVLKLEEQNQSVQQSHGETDLIASPLILFLNLLYPNYFNHTAFDIAMQKKSPKSIEIMLEMLTKMPLLSISKWILPHFNELMTMELTSFNDFISSCQFQQPKMREVKMIKWPYKEDEIYIDYHTSYLGHYFHHLLQKTKKNKIEALEQDSDDDDDEEDEQIPDFIDNDHFNEFEKVVDVDTSSNYFVGNNLLNLFKINTKVNKTTEEDQPEENGQNMKRVELKAVEFDWVFKGQLAIDFVQHLADMESDDLYSNETIQIIILFLWSKFFTSIRNKVFFPFICYFILYIILTSIVYENVVTKEFNDFIDLTQNSSLYYKVSSTQSIQWLNLTEAYDGQYMTQETHYKFEIANYILLGLCFLFWLYFLSIELFQMRFFKFAYFKQFWNYLDLGILVVTMAFFVSNLCYVEAAQGRVLSSVSIFLFYVKAIYFLKLFSPTAAFMRTLVSIILDIRVFVLIWFFIIIAFSNAAYILSQNLDYDQMATITDGTYLQAWMYNYQIQTGGNPAPYNGDPNQALWWITFFIQTLIVQIVFLNMLIAIMGDTFDRVQSTKTEAKLREICGIISEYEYAVDREKMFKNSKYIIVASIEKAETINADDWSGKISALKNVFQVQLQEMKRDMKMSNESIRDELIANGKLIDTKFMDLQQFVLKQGAQTTLMMKKIDSVTEKLGSYLKNQTISQDQVKRVLTQSVNNKLKVDNDRLDIQDTNNNNNNNQGSSQQDQEDD